FAPKPTKQLSTLSSPDRGHIRNDITNSLTVKTCESVISGGIIVSFTCRAKLDQSCFMADSLYNHPFEASNQLCQQAVRQSFLLWCAGISAKPSPINFKVKKRERAYLVDIVVRSTSKDKLERICFITDSWINHPFGAWNQLQERLNSGSYSGSVADFSSNPVCIQPKQCSTFPFLVRGNIRKVLTDNFTPQTCGRAYPVGWLGTVSALSLTPATTTHSERGISCKHVRSPVLTQEALMTCLQIISESTLSSAVLPSFLVCGHIRKVVTNHLTVKKRERVYPMGIVVTSTPKAKLDWICFLTDCCNSHPSEAGNKLRESNLIWVRVSSEARRSPVLTRKR
ncbi:hypothetical protein PSTT_10240, partial [Puccinia striiformis]